MFELLSPPCFYVTLFVGWLPRCREGDDGVYEAVVSGDAWGQQYHRCGVSLCRSVSNVASTFVHITLVPSVMYAYLCFSVQWTYSTFVHFKLCQLSRGIWWSSWVSHVVDTLLKECLSGTDKNTESAFTNTLLVHLGLLKVCIAVCLLETCVVLSCIPIWHRFCTRTCRSVQN